ncbi:methionine--tRNAligase, related [Neospora caninum Liverpool]|uniref:methionine--tRNA ligase n=1 Tax=Neospora caninum (strain Liverpool) TaxID=572307 RepID=F0VBV6_NEOCL|nr:methionine--tRNAligase, related [Neospora caninum Liverpool]CBZ51090.1 methionine--tRNAligase, related [Neospora caninum Liverpool]CEL68397.1 TPA: Methionine--tRNA ligase, related [Neospora caninum Liverpool]|eukprot:XP_003881123.1 methionine--tRNAligase, related [Neospora caninum Liverpool]
MTDSAPSGASSSPLRLLAGCTVPRAEVAACLAVANALKVPVVLSSKDAAESKARPSQASLAPTPHAPASDPTVDEDKKDACVLVTPDGSVVSAYAVCLYFLSVARKRRRQAEKAAPQQEKRQEGEAAPARDAERDAWQAEDALAWAAFKLRGALRGVRKDRLLQQLNSLEERLSGDPQTSPAAFPSVSSLLAASPSLFVAPAMFMFCLLRYAHPTSSFADWPSLAKFLQALGSSPAVAATLHAVPLPSRACGARALTRALLSSSASPQTEKTRERFYITTAINYTNGPPHMGHVYEAVTSDVVARFHRIAGKEVFFLTGTDEHGQKIANTAERVGKTPQEICDFFAAGFQEMNKKLHISNDQYIRTTQADHKAVCQWLWKRVQEKGDIYLDTYVGWYNEREETFVSEIEARLTDYKDPTSGKPLQKMEEASYFFRMSKYQERLLKHIHDNPDFIRPEERRKNILKRLEEPLLDLSCSRTTFTWGVPVPGDEKHVMYVWFDALTNYYSATAMNDGARSAFWPANVHIIGKDIIWFHTVIWPCMLMAAELPLPKCVFGHGFVTAADGEKMSKSLGNVVDPNDILKEHDADSFRFYLVRETKYGNDLRFDEDALTATTNAELADTLGNLVHRATSLCVKFCGGRVPAVPLPAGGKAPFSIADTVGEMERLVEQFALREALEAAMNACREANKFVTDWAPWSLPDPVEKQRVVRGALEAVFVLAHLLEPFIPVTSAHIFKKLNTQPRILADISPWFDNLTPGTAVDVGDILFAKKKVEKAAEIFLQKCELRVGHIISAAPHPHCLKDPKMPPFLVLSVAFSPTAKPEEARDSGAARTAVVLLSQSAKDGPEKLVGKSVIVLVNVKPFTVKGVLSQVLVLAAKPSDGAAEASLLTVATDSKAPSEAALTGFLVQAPGFPPALRARENLKNTEMKAAAFCVSRAHPHAVALADVGPLQVVDAATGRVREGVSVVVESEAASGPLALAL